MALGVCRPEACLARPVTVAVVSLGLCSLGLLACVVEDFFTLVMCIRSSNRLRITHAVDEKLRGVMAGQRTACHCSVPHMVRTLENKHRIAMGILGTMKTNKQIKV